MALFDGAIFVFLSRAGPSSDFVSPIHRGPFHRLPNDFCPAHRHINAVSRMSICPDARTPSSKRDDKKGQSLRQFAKPFMLRHYAIYEIQLFRRRVSAVRVPHAPKIYSHLKWRLIVSNIRRGCLFISTRNFCRRPHLHRTTAEINRIYGSFSARRMKIGRPDELLAGKVVSSLIYYYFFFSVCLFTEFRVVAERLLGLLRAETGY